MLTRSKFGHSVSIIWERGHQGGLARQRSRTAPSLTPSHHNGSRTGLLRIAARARGLRRLQRLRPAGPTVACPGLSSFYEPKRRDDAPHPWLPSRISRLRRPRSSGDNSPRRCSSLPSWRKTTPRWAVPQARRRTVRKSASPEVCYLCHNPRRAALALFSASTSSGGASPVARPPPLNKTARDRSCPPTWQRYRSGVLASSHSTSRPRR